MKRVSSGVITLAALLTVGRPILGADSACGDRQRSFGDAGLFAPVPAPGLPEGIAVRGNKFYVAGQADLFNFGDPEPPKVFEYDICTGSLLATFVMQGQDLAQPHGVSHLSFDGSGRLYVIDFQRGVVRIELSSGRQEVYAPPFPIINPFGLPSLPNEMAFDATGNLYVTDSLQGVIWRIAPGGGMPAIWFQDPRISSSFGPNGIRFDRSGETIYFVVSMDSATAEAGVYTLPLSEAAQPDDLRLFHRYADGEVPDSLAFGRSGKLYVTLASPAASGVSILSPNGSEEARIANAPAGSLSPFDSPACMAFDREGGLLISNHAFFTRIPDHYLVLDVFVDDKGLPLIKPDVR
jgi:sugar lactone lactonase YvrE